MEELEMRLEDGYETREEMMMGQFPIKSFEIGGIENVSESGNLIEIDIGEGDDTIQMFSASRKIGKTD